VTLGDGSVLHVIIEDQNVAWRLIQLPYCCKWKQDVGTTCGAVIDLQPTAGPEGHRGRSKPGAMAVSVSSLLLLLRK
jgi:hypothetical protein